MKTINKETSTTNATSHKPSKGQTSFLLRKYTNGVSKNISIY